MQVRKSCWTCSSRHVRCDGATPSCKACARLGLRCQGYGIRLSWPQKPHSKRAIVGRDGTTGFSSPRSRDFFVNTTWTDVTVYWGSSPHVQPSQSTKLPILQLGRQAGCMDLLRHCKLGYFGCFILQLTHAIVHDEAYRSLVTLDKKKIAPRLRDVLLRLAASKDSAAGLSVYFSLLAYASLHRDGVQAQAVEFKVTAVRLLSASLSSSLSDATTAAQQVATSMLLTACDVRFRALSSNSSS